LRSVTCIRSMTSWLQTGIIMHKCIKCALCSILLSRTNNLCWDRLCGLVVKVPACKSRGPGFDSRCYQIFWEVVRLERGPLSLVRITEELFKWNSGSGLKKIKWMAVRICCDTLYPLTFAVTSPTSGGCSVGIVRLRTKTTEFVSVLFFVKKDRPETETCSSLRAW
jgi:hypothetical protein